MKHGQPKRANRAFTLVELLVVVGIIAVLLGLLLPALGRGKAAARATHCRNNHRQLVLAWQMYADDHGDELPWNMDHGDGVPFTNWVAGFLTNPAEAENRELLVDPRRSLLAQYVKDPTLYKCPSDTTRLARSVSLNNRMNPVRFLKPVLVIGGWGANYMVYRKKSDIRQPAGIFVTLDERHDSINEGNFAVDLSNTGNLDGSGTPTPYWWLDTPGSYHNRGVTLSFADGHVEIHQWQEATTLGPIGITGFRRTSSTDRDIAWLQERTAESVRPRP